MRKFLWLTLILCGCAADEPVPAPPSAPAPPTPERSTVGNGSDYFSAEHDSAWFLGDRKIRYCLQYDPRFGLSRESAEDAINESFERWQRYIVKKNLNGAAFHPERGRKEGDPELWMKHEPMKACDGTQDLTFFLGTDDNRVKTQLARFQRPVGIAYRTEYDPKEGWGKGFIWIAPRSHYGTGTPNWSAYNSTLEAIVTHELGHVAGCGHVAGTVMDENLVALVNRYDNPRGGREFHLGTNMTFIDLWGMERKSRYRELLLCEECEYEAPGFDILDDEELFKRLTGQSFRDDAVLTVSLRAKRDFEKGISFWVGAYREKTGFRDVFLERKFEITGITKVASFRGEAPVFKQVFLRKGETTPATLESRADGFVYTGGTRSESGEWLPLILKRNAEGETFSVDFFLPEGETRRLFRLGTVLKSYGIDI